MDETPALRASNADRERTAQQLHAAAADGRLTMVELDDRLRDTYRAKTLDELTPLTGDLLPRPSVSLSKPGTVASRAPASEATWAILSGIERAGRWVVPERFTVTAVMGGAKLDLREAVFGSQHITISVTVVMGSIEIVVPDDVDVICDGLGLMGVFQNKAPQLSPVSRGSVRVTGFAFWGSVEVRPATKKERKKLAR